MPVLMEEESNLVMQARGSWNYNISRHRFKCNQYRTIARFFFFRSANLAWISHHVLKGRQDLSESRSSRIFVAQISR